MSPRSCVPLSLRAVRSTNLLPLMWSDIYCSLPFGICRLFFIIVSLPSLDPSLHLLSKGEFEQIRSESWALEVWIIDAPVRESSRQTPRRRGDWVGEGDGDQGGWGGMGGCQVGSRSHLWSGKKSQEPKNPPQSNDLPSTRPFREACDTPAPGAAGQIDLHEESRWSERHFHFPPWASRSL